MTALAKTAEMPRSEAIERAITNGDVSGLSPRERWDYYRMRCEAAGLDPRSQPFQYVELNRKLVLYATKSATDQLIANRKISVGLVSRGFDHETGLYEVHARALFPSGQSVEDLGVVWIMKGEVGEKLANAVLKCVTKAKRRTVLSACGLGMLDESEVDDIPGAAPVAPRPIIERPDGPRLVHEPVNEPRSEPVSEAKSWVRSAITTANDRLRNVMLIEGKGDQFKPIANEFSVINHLITQWLADGTLDEATVLKPDGKRDRAKVGACFQVAWQNDEKEIKRDIWEYLNHKATEQAVAAGVEMLFEGSLPESLGGLEDEGWQEGRE